MTSYLPTGLNPGDKFQLIFVTDASSAATEVLIAYYNDYVEDQWGGSTIRTQVQSALQLNSDITWKCIGSTAIIAAKDNVADGSGVNYFKGIYRLDGKKVADNSTHLWRNDLDQRDLYAAPQITEHGSNVVGDGETWTGTYNTGKASLTQYLGNGGNVVKGICTYVSSSYSQGWLQEGYVEDPTLKRHLYALSEILTWPGGPPPPPPVPKNQQVRWNSVLNSKYILFPYEHAFDSLINQKTFADYRNGYIKKLQTETTLDPKK